MKKLILSFLMVSLLFFGCATYDKVAINDLTARIEKLEKKGVLGIAEKAAANFYPCRGIDGDAAGDLDHINGTGLAASDTAFVVLTEDASYGNAVFIYAYTDFGTEVTESLPYRVKPEENSSANYAWELAFSSVAVPVVSAGNITLTIGQARSGIVHITSAGTVTLPKASTVGYGTMLCVYADVAGTVIIDVDNADIINLYGTPLTAGYTIDSPGNDGDYVCLVSTTNVNDGSGTDGWIVFGYGEAAWTDGGAT
jgi:hypothetical protein